MAVLLHNFLTIYKKKYKLLIINIIEVFTEFLKNHWTSFLSVILNHVYNSAFLFIYFFTQIATMNLKPVSFWLSLICWVCWNGAAVLQKKVRVLVLKQGPV